VKAIYKHAEEHREEFNIYIRGEDDIEAEPNEPTTAAIADEAKAAADTKGES
jgi:hypothetical protein